MTEELTKPKYSVCPAKCKIGKLAPNVIDEIDTVIAQGYRLEDVVDKFPLALVSAINVANHKKKHLDMAKILLEFQQQGIKVLDSNNKPQTVEDEVESIEKQNPELAKKLTKLGSSGELPFKSIDLVVERITVVREVIGELYALPSVPHRICA